MKYLPTAALSLLCLTQSAYATPTEQVPAKPTEAPAATEPVAREFEFGATLFAIVNGSFLTEPSDSNKFVFAPDGRKVLGVPYPGFAGVGGGGGLSIVGTWRGYIGCEIQFFKSLDSGEGSVNNIDFTIGQAAWHLPILLRASIPLPSIRPYLFGGPEFVFPGDAQLTFAETQPQAVEDLFSASADSYIAWVMGIGAEFRLPGEQDIRIPFALRFALNPTVGETVEDRTVAEVNCSSPSQCELTKLSFVSEWQYQVGIQLGVAWYFL